MAVYKCTGNDCNTIIDGSNHKGIECEVCKTWVCRPCSNIPTKLFTALVTARKGKDDSSMVMFSCNKCNKLEGTIKVKQISTDLKSISTKLDNLTKSTNQNANEIKLHVDNKMIETCNELKHDINKKNDETYASIAKKCLTPSMTQIKSDIERVIKKTSIDSKIQEKRDRSFIIFNYPEGDSVESKNDDKSFVDKFITEGLSIAPKTIESVIRLGSKGDKVRPIKVTCDKKEDQVSIMRNLSNLKHAEQLYKKCSISIDRNEAQRSAFKKLIDEAKKQSAESIDSDFIVRGSQYKPEIIQIQKRTVKK